MVSESSKRVKKAKQKQSSKRLNIKVGGHGDTPLRIILLNKKVQEPIYVLIDD